MPNNKTKKRKRSENGKHTHIHTRPHMNTHRRTSAQCLHKKAEKKKKTSKLTAESKTRDVNSCRDRKGERDGRSVDMCTLSLGEPAELVRAPQMIMHSLIDMKKQTRLLAFRAISLRLQHG